MKFCPIPKHTHSNYSDSHQRFLRDIYIKDIFANEPPKSSFNPRLYIRSKWEPQTQNVAPVTVKRTQDFLSSTKVLFTRSRGRQNLLTHQKHVLRSLQRQSDLMIIQCDKNLGPAVIERQAYIRLVYRDHLSQQDTYKYLTRNEAQNFIHRIAFLIRKFIKQHRTSLGKSNCTFLTRSLNRQHTEKDYHQTFDDNTFAQFYALAKIHKNPLKTRPVVSYCGCILHPLGLWLDSQLQIVASHQQSFFRSSHSLKHTLDRIPDLPSNACLFTADAISMYTNINTDHALFSIKQYLRNNTFVFRDLPIPAIMDALNIIMRNTIFQFGDTWWVQKSGTAMGAPPAPPYTTIYYGIHEHELLNKYRNELFIYKRFIDDIFCIWIPSTTERWQSFCSDLTYGNLQWEVSPHSTKVDFMDLTIRICNNRIVTTLFEKELNLYLYLPPHSAHPPGVLHGLVIGNILRINNLCSQISDRNRRLKQFYQRLLFRG